MKRFRRSQPLVFAIKSIFLIALLFINSLFAQDQKDQEIPLAIEILIGERDRSENEKVEALKKKYISGLEKFRTNWIGQKRLDDALAALELKSQLEKNSVFDVPPDKYASLRGELRRVIDTWNGETKKLYSDSNEILKKKLHAVRANAIKSGDLDLVRAVDFSLNSKDLFSLIRKSDQAEAESETAEESDHKDFVEFLKSHKFQSKRSKTWFTVRIGEVTTTEIRAKDGRSAIQRAEINSEERTVTFFEEPPSKKFSRLSFDENLRDGTVRTPGRAIWEIVIERIR